MSTTGQLRQRHEPAPSTARDLPMGTFVLSTLVIVGSVAAAALLGRGARPPESAETPLPPPPPLVERSQESPEATTADEPAPSEEPLALPVRVDLDAGVVIIGDDRGDDLDPEDGDDPEALGGAPERLPVARLDEFVRAVGGDEHLRHWLDMADGRRIQVDEETARAVKDAMPFRATYRRDE